MREQAPAMRTGATTKSMAQSSARETSSFFMDGASAGRARRSNPPPGGVRGRSDLPREHDVVVGAAGDGEEVPVGVEQRDGADHAVVRARVRQGPELAIGEADASDLGLLQVARHALV